jgi:hypothetical protein
MATRRVAKESRIPATTIGLPITFKNLAIPE